MNGNDMPWQPVGPTLKTQCGQATCAPPPPKINCDHLINHIRNLADLVEETRQETYRTVDRICGAQPECSKSCAESSGSGLYGEGHDLLAVIESKMNDIREAIRRL